jgi:glycerol-1-phosphate dehydrogenase [NAD(P)+]
MNDTISKLTLEEALRSASETRSLELGHGVLQSTVEVFERHFGQQKAVLVADTNTWEVAGKAVEAAFKTAKHPALEPFIFRDPDLYAEYRFIERLTAALQTHKAIPVAIGSGTINDLTKLSSHKTDRRYMSVATAASMDGYTAFGASITYLGAKQTFTCPAPIAVVADLDVLCRAPGLMNPWGYADLLAKVPAGADWIVADALGAEPIDPHAWAIVQGRLREMTSDPKGVAKGDSQAIGRLTEGLMLGGFAMQYAKSSRPASGAEHQFSHLWDMQHHTHNGKAPSHGFKVAIGTLAVTALYDFLLQQPIDELDVDECCSKWPSLEDFIRRAGDLLKEELLVAGAVKELTAKHSNPAQLRDQLHTLKEGWPSLRERLQAQLLPLATLKQMLLDVGAPVEPEQIGITRERLRNTYRQAFCIRRRFTALDLATRTGLLEPALENIFSSGGLWPIK